MALLTQGIYMLTTPQYFWGEKKVHSMKYYGGELCDLMDYYEKYRLMCLATFFVALGLKMYNNYFQIYCEIHMEAAQR